MWKSVITANFDTNLDGATAFMRDHGDLNGWYPCFYDYSQISTVVLDISFNVVYMSMFILFGAIPVYIHLIIGTYCICVFWFKWSDSGPLTLYLWMALVPFILFGSIYWSVHIDPCLIVGVTFLSVGTALSMIWLIIRHWKDIYVPEPPAAEEVPEPPTLEAQRLEEEVVAEVEIAKV
jgi:hypothetical protein